VVAVDRGQSSEVGGASVGGAGSGQRGVEGRAEGTESERKWGRRLLGAVRFGKPRSREHNRRAQKRKEGGLWTAYSRGQSAGARWQS
jgi:hypothetical protein